MQQRALIQTTLRLAAAAALLALGAWAPSQAQASTYAPAGFYSSAPAGWAQAAPGTLLKYEPVARTWSCFRGLQGYRIMYASRGATDGFSHGGPVFETGMVYIPASAAVPVGGWPVLAWGHGTAGVGDSAAPSKYPWLYPEPRRAVWPEYGVFVGEAGRLGAIVTCPDYEGMGTPGMATYLNVGSEARSMIDAVRAARELAAKLGVTASTSWAAAGHSQGGSAAIGAAEIAATYAPELTMCGTVAFAPAAATRSWRSFQEKNMTAPDWYPYVGYTAWGIKAIDTQGQFAFSDLVGPWLLPYVARAPGLYFDYWWGTVLGAHWTGGVYPGGRPRVPTLRDIFAKGWQDNPVVQRFFADWTVGHSEATGPILLVQGTNDVLYETLPALRSELRQVGDQMQVVILKGRDHDQAVPGGWKAARAFLEAHLIAP